MVSSALMGVHTPPPHDAATGRHAHSSGSDVAVAPDGLDLLSQHLTLMRLRGDVIYAAELGGPWALGFAQGSAHFHFVEQGSALLVKADGGVHRARAGDLLLLPRGLGHTLRSAGSGLAQITFPLENGLVANSTSLRVDGGGEKTRLVSGTFGFEATSASILLQSLPEIISISREEGGNAEWLGTLAHFLLAEADSRRPGAAIMISRLIDVLVVQTLRAWAADQNGGGGWLGGIDDPGVERALSAVHAEPFREWSLSDLAGIAIMSRSVFAERFAAAIGIPPLRYAKRWRLALAEDMLRTGSHKVGEVSRHIGYASEAAFSRAFKAHFGYPPVKTRRSASS